MKIRTRFEKYVLDRLTFVVYLMDHNDNPLEVHYADDIQERERICENYLSSIKLITSDITKISVLTSRMSISGSFPV